MKAPLSLEVSSRLLILVSVGTLILTSEVHPLLATFSVVAVILSFLILWLELGTWLPPKLWNALTVLTLLAFIPDLLWLATSALHAAVHLLFYLMLYRLFHLDTPRAHLQLVLISFLQILTATQYSTELFFGLCFLLFLIVGVWTLMLIHLHHAHSAQALSENPKVGALITPSFFALTTFLSIVAFLFTLGIFFVVPRVSAGLFTKKRPDPVRVAGFSERVDFGSMGPIKLESAIVMRVMVSDYVNLAHLPLYLRGMAFDSYGGTGWSNRQTLRKEIYPNPHGTFFIGDSFKHGVPVHHQILLEPLGTPVLFGFSSPQSVKGDMLSLSLDHHGSAYLPSIPSSRIQYTVDSRLVVPSTTELQAETFIYPDWVSPYLQRTPDDQRIVDLALTVTRNAKTVYEKAKAIETHLKVTYRYSLDAKPSPGRPPIDDFLFGRKTGYCEHFASAMVLMLRGLGIPSRLITGFLQGEWNEYGEYYIVRQRDAHAWVEAYFPQSGWVTFDPTPPSFPASLGWTAAVSHYLDHLRIQWERYIVNYNSLDQMRILSKAKGQTGSLLDRIQQNWSDALQGITSWTDSATHALLTVPHALWFLVLFTLIAVLLLPMLIKRARFSTKRLYITDRSSSQSTQLYLLMLQILESKGLVKKQHLTPNEFLKSLLLSKHDLEKVKEITHAYQHVRFSGRGMTLAEHTRIETLLGSLIKAKPLLMNADE
jgi:hypothetical protein